MRHRGFTMLELQVSLVLLAFGIVTLSSLMMSQTRVMNRVRGDFRPDATIYLTQAADPWVKQLKVPARITSSSLSLTAPTPVSSPAFTVEILSQEQSLTDESLTVTVKLTP